MICEWSEEFSIASDTISGKVPVNPGVYLILQSVEYPRYEGKTRILKIGMSKSDLRQELLNHLGRHTVANRLLRISKRQDLSVTFRFAIVDAIKARLEEKQLLRDFEDNHWDLPVLNSQRGYERNEDRHYREA